MQESRGKVNKTKESEMKTMTLKAMQKRRDNAETRIQELCYDIMIRERIKMDIAQPLVYAAIRAGMTKEQLIESINKYWY